MALMTFTHRAYAKRQIGIAIVALVLIAIFALVNAG